MPFPAVMQDSRHNEVLQLQYGGNLVPAFRHLLFFHESERLVQVYDLGHPDRPRDLCRSDRPDVSDRSDAPRRQPSSETHLPPALRGNLLLITS